ncbi:predicted protein [Streptomyces sp. C]|nr:predicted protein [Streptomyces sp. C]
MPGEEPRPPGQAPALVEQGDGGPRPGPRVDVGGVQPAPAGQRDGEGLVVRGQGEDLVAAQVLAVLQVEVRRILPAAGGADGEGDEPGQQVGRQRRVGGQTLQDGVQRVGSAHRSPPGWRSKGVATAELLTLKVTLPAR